MTIESKRLTSRLDDKLNCLPELMGYRELSIRIMTDIAIIYTWRNKELIVSTNELVIYGSGGVWPVFERDEVAKAAFLAILYDQGIKSISDLKAEVRRRGWFNDSRAEILARLGVDIKVDI